MRTCKIAPLTTPRYASGIVKVQKSLLSESKDSALLCAKNSTPWHTGRALRQYCSGLNEKPRVSAPVIFNTASNGVIGSGYSEQPVG
ncbi:MAG: hypothetical protein GYA34_13295 [Chloroflexi bacterium]|nr:hypothetical protein [Chloroflexota bacterium]